MTRIVVIALAVSVMGCREQGERSADVISGDTVRMGVAWEVAPEIHPAADSLGELSGVAVDRGGNVYASDRMAAKIWIFDDRGDFLTGLGREGDGPGEFRAPTGPAVGPDGRLYVRDQNRVSVFGLDPSSGLLTMLQNTFVGPVYPDWMSTRTTGFDSAGALLYPGQRWSVDGPSQPFMLRFDSSGELVDTIWVPNQETAGQATAFVRTGPHGGRMLPGLNHVPFAPLPVWSVTHEGTIVSGDARSYELVETDADGAVVTTFRRDVPPDRIPDEERRDSIRALQGRLDSVAVPLDQVQGMPDEVRSLDVPTTYPAFMAVYVDSGGDVWVRRWPVGGGDRTIFDVFRSDGGYRHTVVLPRVIQLEPPPFLSSDRVVGVARNPLTDENIIIRFEREGTE